MSEIQLPSHTGQSSLVLISLLCLVKETKTRFAGDKKGTWGHDTPSQQWAARCHWAITEHLFFLISHLCFFFYMQNATSWHYQQKTSENTVQNYSDVKLFAFFSAIFFGLQIHYCFSVIFYTSYFLSARAEHTCALVIRWPPFVAFFMNEIGRKIKDMTTHSVANILR